MKARQNLTAHQVYCNKGYKLIRQYSFPVEPVRHILLRLDYPRSLASCWHFYPRKNRFLSRLSAYLCFLPRIVSAGSRITRTDSTGIHLSCTTVSAEAEYDGQSRQEAGDWRTSLYPMCDVNVSFQMVIVEAAHLYNSKLSQANGHPSYFKYTYR